MGERRRMGELRRMGKRGVVKLLSSDAPDTPDAPDAPNAPDALIRRIAGRRAALDYLVDQTVVFGFFSRHEEIAIGVGFDAF